MVADYEISVINGVTAVASSASRFVKNPHIDFHHCLGQYKVDMQRAVTQGDFVQAIGLCVSSAVSLNIPESHVCGRFIRAVTIGGHEAVELPGGEMVSYQEAVSWLKQTQSSEGGSNGETN